MSDSDLTIADRWMRRFESEHPDVPKRINTQRLSKELSEGSIAIPPSVSSKNGGIESLERSSTPPYEERSSYELDPVVQDAIQARKSLRLTQAKFARCLGISPRTISEWEQGRRQPSGAARTLLHWAAMNPVFIKEVLKSL